MHVLSSEQKIYFQGGSFTLRLSRDFFNNCITKEPFIHSHPDYEFHYVKEGKVLLTVGEEKSVFNENSILIIPPSCPHIVTAIEDNAVTYTFLFSPDDKYKIDTVYSAICKKSLLSFVDTINLKIRLERIKEILINTKSAYIDIIRGELTLLFAELSSSVSKSIELQQKTHDENRAGKIQSYLLENYSSPTCSCEELAKILWLSVRQIHRLCISYYGLPFRDMLHNMRMDIAKHRLALKNNTVKEIAEQLGYSSPASFSSTYKRHYGRSPSKDI